MAENSGIAWTHNTFNRWWGCTMVTDACVNCYAAELAHFRRPLEFPKGYVKGSARVRIKSMTEGLLRKWDRQAAENGNPTLVFAHSMSDIFDLEVPDSWREEEFSWFAKQSNLIFQVLTKRPDYVETYVRAHPEWNGNNIWLGTSLGSNKDMKMAWDLVWPPAVVKWVSYEPALGPLAVEDLPWFIDWVVVGGESGRNARPFHLEWAAETIQKCHDLGKTVFMKQVGDNAFLAGKPFKTSEKGGSNPAEWPEELRVREFPNGYTWKPLPKKEGKK